MNPNAMSRSFSFTFPNPTEDDEARLQRNLDQLSKDIVIGRETGAGGLRHLQGCVRLKQPMRLRAFCALVAPGHVEITRDHHAAVRYCRKEGNMLVDRFTASVQGRRSDVTRLVDALKEGGLPAAKRLCPEEMVRFPGGCRLYVSIGDPSKLRVDMRVSVYVGAPGVGKSRTARLYQPAFELTMPRPGDACWFDGYRGEPHLVIDEMKGQINYQCLMQILDIYPFRPPIKGGFTEAQWTKITITSNLDVDRWYPDENQLSLFRRIHGIFHEPPWDYPNLPF